MTRDEYYAALNNSKEELKHHGIKGQQWGERNGPPYPLDEKGQKKFAKQIEKNMKRNNHSGVHKTIEKSGILEDARSKIDIDNYVSEMAQLDSKAEAMLIDYSFEQEKYSTIAGIMSSDGTLSDISQCAWFYTYEDGDQGFQNSIAVYLHDTNQIEEANDLVTKAVSIDKKFENNVKEYVHDTMGDVGMSEIRTNMYYKTAQKQVEDYINFKESDKIFDAGSTVYYQLSEGADNASWGVDSNKRMADAKKVVSKIDSSIYEFDGWLKFDKVIEELGWSSIRYDEMTDAMWKEINEKVRNMK